MRAYMGSSSYDTSIPHCCGINVVGAFEPDNSLSEWKDRDDYPKIKDIQKMGCGVFVSAILPSQWHAYRQLIRHHTLLFRTGPHKNKGPDASIEGKNKGVYLCVFKHGKEGK
jgi:hypothetical protein